MASLTLLSKVLIGVIVVGAVSSVVWHLGLKEKFGGSSSAATAPASSDWGSSAGSVATTTPSPSSPPPPPVAVSPAPAAPAANTANTSASGLSVAEHAEAGRKALNSGDFAQARSHLEKAVQGGDGASACLLGDMTLKGQGGLAVNRDKAASLFQMAQSKNLICFASGS